MSSPIVTCADVSPKSAPLPEASNIIPTLRRIESPCPTPTSAARSRSPRRGQVLFEDTLPLPVRHQVRSDNTPLLLTLPLIESDEPAGEQPFLDIPPLEAPLPLESESESSLVPPESLPRFNDDPQLFNDDTQTS
jgi:hypothetical protein